MQGDALSQYSGIPPYPSDPYTHLTPHTHTFYSLTASQPHRHPKYLLKLSQCLVYGLVTQINQLH